MQDTTHGNAILGLRKVWSRERRDTNPEVNTDREERESKRWEA